MSDVGLYGQLAPYYDKWNADLDYTAWAAGIERQFAAHFPGRVGSVLDLGCGSGRMTIELAKRGYDMTGVDNCPDMLAAGQAAAEAEGVGDRILWLCQDMRSFELYGTVDAVVCCLDGINHLTDYPSLRSCLHWVHNYLVPGGLFLFDLNSRYKFETVYGENVYTYEDEDAFCVWQNSYSPRRHLADFYITLFTRERDGRYTRADEVGRERMYPLSCMRRELAAAGFTPLSVTGMPYEGEPDEKTERLCFTARAEKP